MNDVELDPHDAIRQAAMTAKFYLLEAYEILDDGFEDWSVRDAIELAKVMAEDFKTAMFCMKMQEIRDAIKRCNDNTTE